MQDKIKKIIKKLSNTDYGEYLEELLKNSSCEE